MLLSEPARSVRWTEQEDFGAGKFLTCLTSLKSYPQEFLKLKETVILFC